MVEAGEKVRPPGEPPDTGMNWLQKVVGGNVGGRPDPEGLMADAFVEERVRLVFPEGEDGEPVVTIESEVLEAMNGLWKNCMIVKVLSRNISISVLSKRLKEMWRPKGAMHVMDLPRQFFMVRFELEDEYLMALTGGPWRAFGSYLMVQAWAPEFNPLIDEIVTTPVWIRLADIPVNFYHKVILLGIAKGLGKPIKVDFTTLNFERGRFARICVEVNLKKPLKGSIMINGARYYVSYEGLSNICSLCGIFGHSVHACAKRTVEKPVETLSGGVGGSNGEKQGGDGFTEVRRSRTRPAQTQKSVVFAAGGSKANLENNINGGRIIKDTANIAISNKFGSLEEDLNIPMIEGESALMEANKENMIPLNNVQKGKSGPQGKVMNANGPANKSKWVAKEGPKEKKPAGSQSMGSNGPKKKPKSTRPMRGLVFGQSKTEIELSESGKRLRVERDGIGRAGGIFENVSSSNGSGLPMAVERTDSILPGSEDNQLQRRLGSAEDPPALFETHASGARAQRICQGLGFDNSFRVDAVGQSGGIWLLWRSEVGDVEIVKTSTQFIHAKVTRETDVVHLIAVYAAPTVSRRCGLWDELRSEIQNITDPLLVGGDFNTIVRIDERMGGSGGLSPDSLAFGEWINDLSLIDMGFKGHKFTWRRGREVNTFVAKRLDRVLCSADMRLKYQEATVTHLPLFSSDHAPLHIQLCPEGRKDPSRRPFRFEAAWMKHESFKALLEASWDNTLTTQAALEKLRILLKSWNKEVFGDVQRRKEKLMNEIKVIQDLLEVNQTNDLLREEEEKIKEFDVVLEQEEMIWYQKSREKVIVAGDRNTRFFHTSTIIRRRRNKIEMLKNDDGRWVSDSQELESLAVNYYKRLYSLDDVDPVVDMLPADGFVQLSGMDLTGLNKPFTPAEVEESIRSMGKYKAPGPDGYQPVFYHECWDVVGPSVIRFVVEFFETGLLPEKMNDALVVLIAKVEKPEKITQFRPISLCNVLFKTITKTMVLRLKRVMPLLIGPAQSSFIPGRLSTDNIVIVQEAVHSMRRKQGRKGWMLLKLDLEKAYDRIRWDFLEDTLKAARLPEKWVGWIMKCVTGPSMQVLWNGEKTEAFQPMRGLRQGDPLSPYLFVLCLERLCHQIEKAVGLKEWKPISLSRGGPKLSHICFADDLILFAEASVSQIRVIRRVLERFCVASGQKVSLEKSKIFFSGNVNRDLSKRISEESGIKATCDLGKYLGMPVLHKRINKDTFGEVVERVSSRLAGWKGRLLSLAGRITLTKSVLSSIPVHSMSTISLPKSTLNSLDRASRSFLWGSTAEKKRQHLMSWKRICRPKGEGGLGIRPAGVMNKALLAKVGWRIIHDRESLWARIMRSKYKVGDQNNTSWITTKSNWSATWRSVGLGLREVVIPGLRWVVGDGRSIKFWKDKWLINGTLLDVTISDVPEEQVDLRVRDLWIDGQGWDLARIEPFISNVDRLRLAAVVVDTVTGVRDRISWGPSTDGKFSVSSAFSLLQWDPAPKPDLSALFGRIWKAMVPERVRVFLWLVVNQVVMTNTERFRRHLSDSSICQVCKGGEETILHVLRDCPAMMGIWDRIIAPNRRGAFFHQSILEWIHGNMGDVGGREEVPWATTFGMAVWWAWKWRCGNVFGENGKCRDRVRFVKDISKEVYTAHVTASGKDKEAGRVERMVSWLPPSDGWVKLNTDGASHGNPGLATAGGVLRDGDGRWIQGFAFNIGFCSATLAELWGVYYGLYLAWERRIPRLQLEVDSEVVVGFLKTGISDTHPLSFLVRLCYGFLLKDWTVRVSHVYREANHLADGLANYAFTRPLGLHLFASCPESMLGCLAEDARGSAYPRRVRL
ncbi:Endonuclease/exonuclease/phosphatase superfamily [Arabidopsis thaliana x Arabidopsis arenosa]|uniref:Endonuclease/exonuclease/phosphatase superfamily n=1 Tax=Arabidopsis thaliana x Arabidopsis arenosa TaxID=1240361 RepID=A0A8T1XJM3_9BRAS|nr:Endonuclease/exonuclease/phosphatase superfamily [Arabidopsis thaliana x Arabidopsis arenosa]